MEGRVWMDGSVDFVLLLGPVGGGYCLCVPAKHIFGIPWVYGLRRLVYGIL